MSEQAFIDDATTIILQREMATLFDAIDFVSMSDDEITWQVFRNLVDNAEFIVGA